MDFKHDKDADAIYLRISERPYAYGEELDPQRRLDYASNGAPIGVELLRVSTRIDFRNLPISPEVANPLLAKR